MIDLDFVTKIRVMMFIGVKKLSIYSRIVLCSLLMLSTIGLHAHTVQIAYCVTDQGSIRLYFEHWHGNLTVAQTADAAVQMTVTDGGTGMTSNISVLPTGVIWDTDINSLPDCKGPLNILSTCASANTYNDWAYWDFVPPACFVDLTVEVTGVVGAQAFIFLEGCGNLMPTSLTDSFLDCVAPTITCPADITIEANSANPCGARLTTGFEPTILFDDCTDQEDLLVMYDITGAVTVENGVGFVNDFFTKGSSTVVYTVTDETDKASTCSFDITIEDLIPPGLRCPARLNVSCDDPNGETLIQNWLESIMADDACTSVTTDNDYSPTTVVCDTQIVTYTATDECGNTASCTSTITIFDRTNPEIMCPDDITVECGEPNNDAIIANWLSNADAMDSCVDDVTITNNFAALSTDACGGVSTVTFTAEDTKGNRATCSARLTHQDTQAPEFIMKPRDITVNCINANGNVPEFNGWLLSNGGGMAQDECDATVTWTREEGETTMGCGLSSSIEYSFIIEDDCGQTNIATASFTVIDDTPPTLNVPIDRTISCSDANRSQIDNAVANASGADVCSDNAEVTVDAVLFNTISGCGATFTEVWQFTATDPCGNVTTGLSTFVIEDTGSPTWVGPPGNLFIECGDPDNPNIIAQWLDEIEATMEDPCGGELQVTNNWDGSLPEECNQTIPLVFEIVDECGNVRNNLTRNIVVRDRINPVFLNCPNDMTVNVDVDLCSSNVIFATPIPFDQCTPQDELTVIQVSGLRSGTVFPLGTTEVEFEVRDVCDRVGRCSFDITVVDSDFPDINCPSNVEACINGTQCQWVADDSVLPLALGNCDAVSTQYEVTGATSVARGNGDASGVSFNVGTSEVCYFLEDDAGNESSCCFDVIVSDCQAPRLTCPEDITVDCTENEVVEIVEGDTGQLIYNHNGVNGTSYAGDNGITAVVGSASDISFGPGLTLLNSSGQPTTIPNGTNFEHVLTGVATNDFNSALAADDYVETCFTTVSDGMIDLVQQGLIPAADGGSGAGTYQVTAAISSDGFASNSILYQGAQVPDPNVNNTFALYQHCLLYTSPSPRDRG